MHIEGGRASGSAPEQAVEKPFYYITGGIGLLLFTIVAQKEFW